MGHGVSFLQHGSSGGGSWRVTFVEFIYSVFRDCFRIPGLVLQGGPIRA
jgi:hypothetical protein